MVVDSLKSGQKAERGSFVFGLFLVYICFLFLRPVELFAPWLADFRPMMIIWIFAFGGGLMHVLRLRDGAALATHYWILFWLTIAVVMSQLWRGYIGGVISSFSDFIASPLLFLMVSFHVINIRRLRITCLVIVLSLLVLSICGIAAYHTGYKSEDLVMAQYTYAEGVEVPKTRPPVPVEDKSGAYRWRVRGVGLMADPNDFAQAIIAALPMLLLWARKGAWLRNLLFLGAPGLVMAYCISLTQSRGSLLGVGAMIFFAVRTKLGNLVSFIMLGAGVAAMTLAKGYGGREISSKERSAEERIEAWYEGINMLKSSPLFGIGHNSFTEHHYLTAHNSFVLGFAELGLFGYFFWMASLVLGFTVVGRLIKYAPPGTQESQMGHLLRASLVGYMACAWFLSRTYQPILFCLLALCAAAWLSACRSAACAGIAPLSAPLKWAKNAAFAVVISIVAVRVFIIMR